MTLSPGTLLNNRYRILSVLGTGGMGSVYHAIDENLGVPVAVKENLFLSDEYARQFQREASILASLRHPNLPRVGDYFTIHNQGQYLIMDYIEGEDLRMRLERLKRLPEKDVIIIGAMICEALAYLHSRKPPIVHRDIKPGNIKITPEGEISLVDFGLAKVMIGGEVTTTGARAMTPGYSPPEQYGTARTDARSDIYSLGATLYAALTGMIPEEALSRATGKEELTPIRDLVPHANKRLVNAIETALAIDPDERFQTAKEFQKALIEAADFRMASIGPITVPPPPPTVLDRAPSLEEQHEGSDGSTPPPLAPPRSKPRKKKRSSGWLTIPLLLFITAGLVYLVILRPDISAGLLRQFIPVPAPTATVATTPTEAAAATMPSPTQPAPSPTPLPLPTATLPSPTEVTRKVTPMGGGTGQIAFASNRTGAFQIWLMNTDGSDLTQLTRQVNGACQPAWSPDGSQIVFVSPCQPKNDTFPGGSLFVMNADGSNIRPLLITLNLEGDFSPNWSPDGRKIAYTSLRGGRPQIAIFYIEDAVSIVLSKSNSFDSNPVWSPNGKYIAFVRQTITGQIWLMNEKGENTVQFNASDPSLTASNPAWTPDSQLILFSQAKSNQNIPWLMAQRLNDQGTLQEFRVPPSGQDIGPVGGVSVSPDGFLIAFESWPDGKNHDIYLMTINGADRVPISTDPAYDFGPAWRPRKPGS